MFSRFQYDYTNASGYFYSCGHEANCWKFLSLQQWQYRRKHNLLPTKCHSSGIIHQYWDLLSCYNFDLERRRHIRIQFYILVTDIPTQREVRGFQKATQFSQISSGMLPTQIIKLAQWSKQRRGLFKHFLMSHLVVVAKTITMFSGASRVYQLPYY